MPRVDLMNEGLFRKSSSQAKRLLRSDEGLALETLYGGQFTLSTQLMKPNYPVILPPTQHHSFFRNLPPLLLNNESQIISTIFFTNFLSTWNFLKNELINMIQVRDKKHPNSRQKSNPWRLEYQAVFRRSIGFDFCQGLRFFLCLTLMSCWSVHFFITKLKIHCLYSFESFLPLLG